VSLPNSFSQLVAQDVSDDGLATSTQRLAVNAGHTHPPGHKTFGRNAKAIGLRKLDSFLGKLPKPSFSQWTDVLNAQEITEYQYRNHRKFPLLHLIPKGLSLSDLKSNNVKSELVPGLENDCWRFLVNLLVLSAGSPFSKYITVNIFRLYTQAVLQLFSGNRNGQMVDKMLAFTGEGSLTFVTMLLICLLLIYKCRKTMKLGLILHSFNEVAVF
jgi:hypothetical protein